MADVIVADGLTLRMIDQQRSSFRRVPGATSDRILQCKCGQLTCQAKYADIVLPIAAYLPYETT
jgi:hypothetical protein